MKKRDYLSELKPDNLPVEDQVQILSEFLWDNFSKEFGNGESEGEGAVEMTVRILSKLKPVKDK